MYVCMYVCMYSLLLKEKLHSSINKIVRLSNDINQRYIISIRKQGYFLSVSFVYVSVYLLLLKR